MLPGDIGTVGSCPCDIGVSGTGVVLEVLPVHELLMDPVQEVLHVAPMALEPNPVVVPDFPGMCLGRAF